MAVGFKNVRELVDSEYVLGNKSFFTFRKVPSQTTALGIWTDLSMAPGNPLPQYYAASPLIAKELSKSEDGGLNHGGNVSPLKKVIRKLLIMTQTAAAVPCNLILCDYLLFYPFIDEGTTDSQTLDNTATLPRYVDGEGTQVMAIAVAPHVGGQSFFFNYTNSQGVSNRTSKTVVINTTNTNGTIITTSTNTLNCNGPFIPLQDGDTGVRSIESVTMLGVDIGLFTLVLVKPLATLTIRGIDAPVEVDYFKDFASLPEIQDDAYLNFIASPGGNMSGAAIQGYIETSWL
jgi:hypothetical protein